VLRSFQEILQGDAEYALRRLWSREFSEAEAMTIRTRVGKDPKYREDLFGSLEILGLAEELASDSEIQKIVPEYRRLIQGRRKIRKVLAGMAASVLIASGAALAYFSLRGGAEDGRLHEYFTRIGEQQTVELDDGSVFTLNTGGQIMVDYTGQVRRILLKRGEAFFDVAENPERPFTVDLGLQSVTAMGTQFNIRKHPDGWQVTVIEGVIALHELTEELSQSPPLVSADGEAVVISAPGQHRVEEGWVVEFDAIRNELTAFRPESMDRYQQWRSGMISFYGEPLYRVVQELNRYSRKRIVIEDTSVLELAVYTAVRVDGVDSALNALEQLPGIEVKQYYDRIVISGSGGN